MAKLKPYNKKVPKLISNTVSNADELSRWILDLHGIQYIDERHAPGLHIKPCNKAIGNINDNIANNPVLLTTDAVAYKKDGVLKYTEFRVPLDKRLYPQDETRKKEAEELFEYFWHNLWRPVGRYVYANILPYKKYTAPLMKEKVPFKEKIIVNLFYKFLAKAIAKGLELEKPEYAPDKQLEKIKEIFDKVENILSDGRKYLTGDTFTPADMMFATNVAPVILPPNFGGAIAKIQNLPDNLRKQIEEFRQRPAGQFAIRMYEEHRPPLCDQSKLLKEPSRLSLFFKSIQNSFFGRKFKLKVFTWLGKKTVLKFGKNVLVARHVLMKEVLDRNEDFTIKEINAVKMQKLYVPFFLGMDKSPQHDREVNFTRGVVKKTDIDFIRSFIKKEAKHQIQLAQEFQKIDIVSSYARVIMTRFVEAYFGVTNPHESTMQTWMRDCFYDLFLNLGNNEKIHQKAVDSATDLRAYLENLITERQKIFVDKPDSLEDNLLNRMIIQSHKEGFDWVDNDTIRRNISGLIIGALDTTSKSVVLVLDELFHRPKVLVGAMQKAQENDIQAIHQYSYEALRFNPHNPVVLRFNEEVQTIGRKYKIKAKRKIFAGITPAMFDKNYFPEPKKFKVDRDLKKYINFGYGMHECYGTYINAITIPELVMAILQLKELKRGKGRVGKILMDGPFPNNFVVRFEE